MGPILKTPLPSRLLLTDAIVPVGLGEAGVDGAGDEEHSHGGGSIPAHLLAQAPPQG